MIKMTMSINKQCFSECVNSFREDTLTQQEAACVQQCAKRHAGAFSAMEDIQGQLMGAGGKGGMF